MKLAIVGSRNFRWYDLLSKWAHTYITGSWDARDITIISGGAKGADSLAEDFADEYGYEIEIFYPHWNELGKAAGFIRNKQIVDACDMVLAFWDGKSKGTEHTIRLAREAKKPTFIVYF
jgi:predicted Rossmann fold nucleotide-binding protein DprA/Smf involved in DNA uptake